MLVWICGWRKKVANDKYLLNRVWKLMDAVCSVLNDNFVSLLKKQDIAISFCVYVCAGGSGLLGSWLWICFWVHTVPQASHQVYVCIDVTQNLFFLFDWLQLLMSLVLKKIVKKKGQLLFSSVSFLMSLCTCGVLDAAGRHHSSFYCGGWRKLSCFLRWWDIPVYSFCSIPTIVLMYQVFGAWITVNWGTGQSTDNTHSTHRGWQKYSGV